MKNKSIWSYLLGTFLLSYIMWGIILLGQELSWFQYGTPITLVPIIIGANCPAIIAFFVLRKQKNGMTLKQYLKDAFMVKQKLLHYVVVALFVAIFFGIPAIMGGIAYQLDPYSGGTETTAPMPIWITTIAIPFFFFLGGSEELGWRRFLQPQLEKKMPFVPATLLTAFIWCVWHLPLFAIIGTSQNSSNIVSFTLYIVGTSFALAAIYRISKSSWLCILFHCATNALQGSLPLIDDYYIKGVTSAVLILAAFVVMFFHKKHLSKVSLIDK